METMDLPPVKKFNMHQYVKYKILIGSRWFFLIYIYACVYLYVYIKDIKMGG